MKLLISFTIYHKRIGKRSVKKIHNRLGGNAIADIIVFGRIAGQNVVK